jgi:hypothetical protein
MLWLCLSSNCSPLSGAGLRSRTVKLKLETRAYMRHRLRTSTRSRERNGSPDNTGDISDAGRRTVIRSNRRPIRRWSVQMTRVVSSLLSVVAATGAASYCSSAAAGPIPVSVASAVQNNVIDVRHGYRHGYHCCRPGCCSSSDYHPYYYPPHFSYRYYYPMFNRYWYWY